MLSSTQNSGPGGPKAALLVHLPEFDGDGFAIFPRAAHK